MIRDLNIRQVRNELEEARRLSQFVLSGRPSGRSRRSLRLRLAFRNRFLHGFHKVECYLAARGSGRGMSTRFTSSAMGATRASGHVTQ